jgi:hypothetical protein
VVHARQLRLLAEGAVNSVRARARPRELQHNALAQVRADELALDGRLREEAQGRASGVGRAAVACSANTALLARSSKTR